MKPARILGGILAAGGGVALVTAMTAMEPIGDCGNGYDPPCPPGIENDVFLMAGAVISVTIMPPTCISVTCRPITTPAPA